MSKGKDLRSLLVNSSKGIQQQRLDTAEAHDGLIPPHPSGSESAAPGQAGSSDAQHPSGAEPAVPDAAGSSGADQHKVVREFFSMPPEEQSIIGDLTARAAREGKTPNKSQIIRAALKYLASSSSEQLVSALDQAPRVKPGKK
jgi:hypothetical protein